MSNPTWLYVGVLYALAVWLGRRAKADLPLRVAVLFYALVLVFLFLPMTQEYVSIPVDFLKELPPWAHLVRDRTTSNGMMNDIVLQIVPWAHQVREAWKSFTPPLWNHLSAAGYPLLANPQTAALSPIRFLALPLPLGHAMTAEAAMKLLAALTFAFLFCRRRGWSELASTFGAVAFGFSMFLVTWLHFPLATSAALLPAVLYAIDLLAERITYGRFVFAAAIGPAMLFGGHPETVGHTAFVSALYALWIAFVERSARPGVLRFFGTLLAVVLVGVLIAAPLLAPFAEALPKSKRYHELKAAPHGPEVPYSDFPSMIVMLQPQFWGELPFEEPWGPAHAESITAFAGFLGVAGWFALLAHVIATRGWRSREAFFLLLALFAFGVVMSWPLFSDAFHLVFGLAANARLRLVLALLFAVQTAALVDLIQRGRRAAALFGIACASALLLWFLTVSRFENDFRRDTAVLAILPSAGVLALATIAALVRRRELALMFVLTGVVAELWENGRDWNPSIEEKWMYPRTPALEKLDQLFAALPEDQPYRMVGAGATLFPNLPAVFGYEDVRPHDPMSNGRYVGLLRHITRYDPSDYFAHWTDFDTRFLDYLNVRYVLTPWRGDLPPERYTMLYDARDGRIFENRGALPRFFPVRNVVILFNDDLFAKKLKEMDEQWDDTAVLETLELENRQMHDDFFNPRPADAPMATARIISAKPTDYRLHVKAPRYSLIVSSIPWWNGWKVERNGVRFDPIKVNGGFLGFAVPEGELDVRVWFDPWTFRYGAIVSGLTIAALIAFGVRLRRSATPPSSEA